MPEIVIVPYDPRWPDEFARLAAPLRQAAGDLALRVDHIGSTAVPGLAAKDIIDIQVTALALAPALEDALASLGYARRAEIMADHHPPRSAGPAWEWEKWYFRPPAHLRPTHLHVRVQGRANGRYALLFRDYLRAHPVAADAYGLVKRQLARRHADDAGAYYDVKDPVCDILWSAAEDWARAAGWQP